MATVINQTGLLGANGTNGLIPTAGKAGGATTANYSGMINADSVSITATGGNGGNGGNNTGAGAGGKGGDGGASTVNAAGNIFKPLGSSLDVLGTAIGGNGGLGGTGGTAGAKGNGGNATIAFSGNIVNSNTALSEITFDAVAEAGTGAKYGNASATVSGNIVNANNNAGTDVFLLSTALSNGPDATANNGNSNFGTKTATVSGNILNGYINNVNIFADALLSNATATISGNILNSKPSGSGAVALEATGQKIAINGNILNLGQQEVDIILDELGPTYNAQVSGNIFNGTGNNTLVLVDTFNPGPAPTPNTAVVNLGTGTLLINGQSNIINKFGSVTLGSDWSGSITGSNGDNTLNGGAGNDYLSGMGGNDTLNGNGGNDILFGGAGSDTIDGGAGLDVAYFSGLETQYGVQPGLVSPGPFTVTIGTDADTLTNVERIKFLSPTHVSDLNNDGLSDFVFQDSVTNTVTVGIHPGPVETALTPAPAAGTKVIGTGQFNPDVNRNADILLQDASGNLTLELDINSGTGTFTPANVTGAFTGAQLNANWKAIATGDFNGDAASDIVLQNSATGAVEIMLLNSNSFGEAPGTVDSTTAVTTPGANWKVISSGDFDGDGKSDLLWQNSVTGQTEVYLMNGAAIGTAGSAMSPAAGLKAIGTGDFNNDGKSDIIYEDTTGGANNAVIWLMNGTSQTGSPITVANPGLPTTDVLLGAEDINGDGYSDLLWQDTTTGLVTAVEMTTGGAILGTTTFTPAGGATFKLIASTGGG